eukprot:2849343-Pyramimonas_sp.AAC.1
MEGDVPVGVAIGKKLEDCPTSIVNINWGLQCDTSTINNASMAELVDVAAPCYVQALPLIYCEWASTYAKHPCLLALLAVTPGLGQVQGGLHMGDLLIQLLRLPLCMLSRTQAVHQLSSAGE